MKLVRLKIVFTGLPKGYQTSFWAENFGIFIISSIAAKKEEQKFPLLPILAGSLVCISLTTMSSTESSICSSLSQWTFQDATAARVSVASGGSGVPLTI